MITTNIKSKAKQSHAPTLWNILYMLKLIWHLPTTTKTGSKFNTLKPRKNGRHFADDTFKRIFVNENVWILIEISLKFVPKGPINTIPALVQIMAWRRPGDKPLSEPMMVCLPTHICFTRPQWVKAWSSYHIHMKLWSVIVHPCLFKLPCKLDHGWGTASYNLSSYSQLSIFQVWSKYANERGRP